MPIKNTIKSLRKDDFHSTVDLHLHTNMSDGTLSPAEIIEIAKNKKLKLISITDHNTIQAHLIEEVATLTSPQIITGVEFDCWHDGVFIHILGYGFDPADKKLLSLCDSPQDAKNKFKRFFSTRSVKNIIDSIHNAGGIASFAHPACAWAINLEHFTKKLADLGLDAIEVYYPYERHRKIIKFHCANKIEQIANNLGLLKTGGTDLH